MMGTKKTYVTVTLDYMLTTIHIVLAGGSMWLNKEYENILFGLF